MTFGWGYPPGVSPNDPHLTGEWPCFECAGEPFGDQDDPCMCCSGSGIEPDDYPLDYLHALAEFGTTQTRAGDIVDWARRCRFDRADPVQRRTLRAVCAIAHIRDGA